MKSLFATLGCLVATVLVARGQAVSIELVLDQEQYLPGEALVVKARVANFTGQELKLGTDETWLSFTVEDSRHLAVSKRGTVPVKGEFSLEPSMTGTKRVDLAPYFDLTQPGRYYVSATLLVPQWRHAVQCKAVSFDIIRGNSLWEQEFGVPGSANDSTAVPEIRRYALLQTSHSRVIQLYFRLTDSKGGQIFRIYPLGQMVSFSNPEPQVDRFSNFHVLYQASGRTFIHCLVNPDGVLVARETYEYAASRPVLRAETDGRISVVGGQRRVMPNDLPPPVSSTAPSNAKLPQP